MFKTDIIKTYIFKPNYYEYVKYNSWTFLKIFNNNILYLCIKIYNFINYFKTKKINKNYIIISYFNHSENKISCTKIKKYDITMIDIISGCTPYNFDLKISDGIITKKIDNNIYIIYYYKKYIIKDGYYKAIKRHKFYNSKYYCYKYYNRYYINYYIIINLDIKYNIINKAHKFNTIFCNFSRNFIIII